jgi:hypothetical protein
MADQQADQRAERVETQQHRSRAIAPSSFPYQRIIGARVLRRAGRQ